jgi:hypothetical protein
MPPAALTVCVVNYQGAAVILQALTAVMAQVPRWPG